MAIRPEVPASVRYYFRARLRPFTRPAFWGSLSVLSLIGLFAWEAWQHPEWLFKNPENATPIADTELSKEDSAVAADIDSLPVLMQELDEAEISTATLKLNQPSKAQSFLDDYLKAQSEQAAKITDNALATQPANTPVTVYDPLGTQTQGSSSYSSPPSVANQAASPTVGVAGTNAVGGSNLQNPNALPVSPLQAALDRLGNNSSPASAQNQTQINSSPATTNSLGQPTQTNAAAAGQTAQPGSPYTGTTNYSNMPVQVSQPGSAYPGNPGAGVVPATSNPTNSYTYLNPNVPVPVVPTAQQVTPQVAPLTQSNYGVPVYQNQVPVNAAPNNFGATQIQPSQLQPSAFSVPRPIPGRYIGGGQINTFSNP